MFDQLVESSGKKKDTVTLMGVALGVNALLGITTMLFALSIITIFSVSLWSMLPSIDDQDLELTTLVAPPPAPQVEPPKPDQPKEKPTTTQVEDRTITTRTELQTSVDDTRMVPKEVASTGKQVPPIPKTGGFVKGTKNVDPSGGEISDTVRGGGTVVPPKPPPPPKEEDDAPPPPKPATPTPKPTEKPTPPPTPKAPSGPVSGGVVNGKARNLVKPAYPPAAKAVRASGAVNVQVLIDEGGRVVSASAVSGHPLLRAAAEQAARSSSFSPTMLSGQAVKVSGTIVYNFVPQ